MKGELARRLRREAPPRAWLVLFCILYLPFLAGGGERGEIDPRAALLRTGLPLVALAALGAWRVLAFHPARDPSCRAWLVRTPWRPPAPLPLGHVTLGAVDAALIGVGVALVARHGDLSPVTAVSAALAGHIGASLAVVDRSRLGHRFGLWTGLGLATFWIATPVASVAALLLAELVAVRALGFSLEELRVESPADRKASAREVGGWALLAPEPNVAELPARSEALARAVVAGGWTFVVLSSHEVMSPGQESMLFVLSFAMASVAAAFRLIVTTASLAAPVDLAGRIALRLWILPRHDGIYLAPLAILLSAGLLPWALFVLGAPVPVALALGVAGAVAAGYGGPPSPRRYALTGDHRLRVPGG